MKSPVLMISFLMSALMAVGQTTPDDRIMEFLKKVDTLHAKNQSEAHSPGMPNVYTPRHDTSQMPNMNLRFLDHDTGLQYSGDGRIYHDTLAVGFDVTTGIVYDFQNKKTYTPEEIDQIKEQYKKKEKE